MVSSPEAGSSEKQSRERRDYHLELEGFTPLLYSPTGLDLKLAKRAPNAAQSRDSFTRGDQIWGSF